MKDRVRKLVESLVEWEKAFRNRPFLAPVVPGGSVRVKIAGILSTFKLLDGEFSGWGVFEAYDEMFARLNRRASYVEIERYLAQLKPLKAVVIRRIDAATHVAWPANESDMRQRFGRSGPLLVRLAEGVASFDQVIVRTDGANFWFEDIDRREDPRIAEYLRRSLAEAVPVERIAFPGLTPEARRAYGTALAEEVKRNDSIMKSAAVRALEWGGGTVEDIVDRGDSWLIRWVSRRGRPQTSLVRKHDHTVLSAGICLDGRDQEFDIKSLVSVIEEFERTPFGW